MCASKFVSVTFILLFFVPIAAQAENQSPVNDQAWASFSRFSTEGSKYTLENYNSILSQRLNEAMDEREKQLIRLWGDRYFCLLKNQRIEERDQILIPGSECTYGTSSERYGAFSELGKKLNEHLSDRSARPMADLLVIAIDRLRGKITTDEEFIKRLKNF